MPVRIPTHLDGPVLIAPDVHGDSRGFFLETYSERAWDQLGVAGPFVQGNHSRSAASTIRGLHFQTSPGQSKLVRVARGRVWDVVLDIRRSSPTFGAWEAFELDDERHLQIYVPVGFAHGFCAISEVADVAYMVGSYYDPVRERGIAWNDPVLAIPWPAERPLVSERDSNNPTLAQIAATLPDW